jgi:undecaprenyl-diphosphatase
MSLFQVLILAIVQGLCELLPVSSSAHVIVAEKLMGLDPTTPAMTLLLVALHTGTMFAVIVYFRRDWKTLYFSRRPGLARSAWEVALATAATGAVGLALLRLLPAAFGLDRDRFEVEQLFGDPRLIAAALAAAGVLIVTAGLLTRRRAGAGHIGTAAAAAVGAVQGLCLPFRGFSRSGATISTALLMGVARDRAESFSFALAVVLTPAVIVRELHRFLKAHAAAASAADLVQLALPIVLGMALSFLAGLLALRWLSRWLEHGRWHYFGAYCLAASALVAAALGRA